MNSSKKSLALITMTLIAFALTGCSEESSISAPQDVVLDTAPPAVPTGLAAAPAQQNVKVTWEDNVTDADFAGFMVYRIVWGNQYPMLEMPTQGTVWFDNHPVDVACTYAVTALDINGNESAWSAVNFLGMPEGDQLSRD